MTEAKKRLYLNVIRRKIAEGEELADILDGIRTLTDEDKEALRAEVEEEE